MNDFELTVPDLYTANCKRMKIIWASSTQIARSDRIRFMTKNFYTGRVRSIQTQLIKTQLIKTQLIQTRLIQIWLIQTRLIQTQLIQTQLIRISTYFEGNPC